MTQKNRHIGSRFESWLDETGIRPEVTAAAIKAVIARQLAEELKKKRITRKRMADLMETSRAQLDRLLDPDNGSATIESLQRAREHRRARAAVGAGVTTKEAAVASISRGCRRPTGAGPGAAEAGRICRRARSSHAAGRRDDGRPSSGRSVACPRPACGAPGNSGSTTGTSRADRPDGSTPCAAIATTAGPASTPKWFREQSRRDGESLARRTSCRETPGDSRSCTCRRTHRARAFRRGVSSGSKSGSKLRPAGADQAVAISLLHPVIDHDGSAHFCSFDLLPCSRLVTDNAPECPRGKYEALGWNGQGGLARTGGQA